VSKAASLRVVAFAIVGLEMVAWALQAPPAGTIAFLLVIQSLTLLTSIRLLLLHRRRTAESAPVRFQRARPGHIVIGLFRDLVVAGVVFGSYDHVGRQLVGWTVGEIGCSPPIVAPAAVIVGLLLSVPYSMFMDYGARRSAKKRTAFRREDLAVLGQNLPRGRVWQIVKLLELVIISPVLEEIVYRGFFVYCLGTMIGNVVLALVIGLVMCLCLHLYQGWHLIHRHIAFYAIVVSLLYSPLGLTAAIGFHVGCNFRYAMHVAKLARVLRNWSTARMLSVDRFQPVGCSTGARPAEGQPSVGKAVTVAWYAERMPAPTRWFDPHRRGHVPPQGKAS
jgi:hypothetical protein